LQIADRLEVAGGGRPDAAGSDQGLAEERRDALGSDVQDLVLERLRIVVCDVRDRLDERAVALPQRLHREARAEAVRAVVGVGAADQVGPLGAALEGPVLARELAGGVDRVAAAEAQEELRILHGSEGGDAIGELERRRVREVAERLVGLERPQLARDRLDDLLAPVADVAVPEARRPVQVALAGGIPDVNALAAGDHQLVPCDRRHVGERMPVRARSGHPATLRDGGITRSQVSRPRRWNRVGGRIVWDRVGQAGRRAGTT
jgi:hypothetical protein